MTLIKRHGVQFVGARPRRRLHQHIGALSRRHQQLLQLLHTAQLDAVVGDNVQPVLVELQQHVVLILRGDQSPALHLAWSHVDDRLPLTIDGEEAGGGFRKERAEILDHAEGVEHDLRQQHDALAGASDLRRIGEVAFDDDGARHAACHLHIGRAVVMRMVPVGAARVVRGQRDLDLVRFTRQHRAHDVIRDAARAAVRAVEMEVRVVELVRMRRLGRISRLGGRSLISRIFRVSPGFTHSVGPSPPS
jgi:hypothetical protein